MNIQKYKAKIKYTGQDVIGYISETRKYLGDGCYSQEIEYVISVTSISMPGGLYGTHIVEKNSIEKYNDKEAIKKNYISRKKSVDKIKHFSKL